MGLFFRDYESEYHAKHLGPYTMFNNEDLDDCIRPMSTAELDPSIINLRGDPHKHIFVSRKMKDEVVVSLDRRQDMVLRVELLKFFDDDGGTGWYKKLKEDQIK